MPEKTPEGKIVTFYSYKGGTGRSMALANVAWILASNGKRVLTLDWDMEAPGLHRYFYPFLIDKDLSSSEGLIDFVIKFVTASATPPLADEEDEAPAQNSTTGTEQTRTATKQPAWYEPYANILRYATSLNWNFENGGTLDFIPSGRQGPSYGTRVNSFNWKRFYEVLNGGILLEIAKEKMRAEYDYILIDSRTGVSDTSGICTVQMPDILVICFTLNNQSIEGASSIATSVYEQRAQSAKASSNNGRAHKAVKAASEIHIFPVPTRIENAEKVKLQTRKDYAKDKFKLFPNSVPGEEREQYWGNVPIIYVPYYAYEEILAPFGDNSADRISILAAAEQLTSYLTEGEITKLPTISDEERKRILTQFETGVVTQDPAVKEDAFAEYVIKRLPPHEQEMAHRVFTRLVRVAGAGEIGGDMPLCIDLDDFTTPDAQVLRKLIDSTLIKKDYDYRNKQETVAVGQDSLLKSWKRLQRWLDEDRDFLLWRQRLDTKIDEWEKNEKETGALLSGTLLDEAEKWLKERPVDLNTREASYINASTKEVKHLFELQKESQFRHKMFRLGVWAAAIIVVMVSIGIYTAIHPLKTEILEKWKVYVQHDYWIISKDHSVAVSFTKNKPSSLWKLGTEWKNQIRIDVPFDRIIISPHAKYLAGLTTDRRLFVWQPEQAIGAESKPALTIPTKQSDKNDDSVISINYPMGFSPDDKWVYLLSPEGVYLLQPGQTLGSIAQPTIPVKLVDFSFSPKVVFSPGGKYIAVTDAKGNLVIRRLNDITRTSPPFKVYLDSFFETPSEVFFSNDDQWVAANGTDGKIYMANLNLFPGITFQPTLEPSSGSPIVGAPNQAFRVFFSPNPANQWVIAKRPDGELYAWRLSEPPGKKAKPLIEPMGRGPDTSDSVAFNANGSWIAVRQGDFSLYVWQLGKDSGRKLEPVISRVEFSRVLISRIYAGYKFSPNGDWIAASSTDGRVFIWKLGSSPDLTKSKAFLAVDNPAYNWTQDNAHIFVYGGGDVFFGDAEGDKELTLLPRSTSLIQGIAELTDPKTGELNELIIFGDRYLYSLWQRRSFWNYTYRIDAWPDLVD